MSIGGKDLLAQIEARDPKLGAYFRNYVLPAIQTTAENAAVNTHGDVQPPSPPESVSIKTSGELMQVVVNHTAPVVRGARTIVHIATNPQFTNALIDDRGCSRCPPHYNLPTKDSSGNTHSYYIAAVVQYPGSRPSAPTYYGGSVPVPVTMGGATQMDLLPGTGSGTASNGGQALVGMGKAKVRL